jgi:hypothetical protein
MVWTLKRKMTWCSRPTITADRPEESNCEYENVFWWFIYIHAESMFAVTQAAEVKDQKQAELQERQSL